MYNKLLEKWYHLKNKQTLQKDAPFKPQISKVSKEMAKRKIRCPTHLEMKVREARNPVDIEYEKNMNECTF